MRLRYVLILLAFAGVPFSCWASLGDTLRQCTAHYGKPISHGSAEDKGNETGLEWYAFKAGAYEYEEHFYEGVVVMEIVWKPKDSLDSPSARLPFSISEQAAFLASNSDHRQWGKPQPSYKATVWKRIDGADAMYSTIDNEMNFASRFTRH
jgi:hypothetical protein